MYILRIQNAKGEGCITGLVRKRFPYELDNEDGSKRRIHPDAEADTELAQAIYNRVIQPGSKFKFGFASLGDLYRYFTPVEVGWFETGGFTPYLFEISDEFVLRGLNQVAFESDKVISCRPLTHRNLRRLQI